MFRALLTGVTLIAAWVAPAALSAAPNAPPRSGPTLAVEDTMRTELPEMLVHAPRITLEDILDRVARGEAHRDSLIRDQVYTVTARVVRNVVDAKKKPELISETVSRVYKRKPDQVRGITLRKWELKPPKNQDDSNFEINYRADTSEELVNFAFRPEGRREFKFKIAGRDLVGDRVIYRIAFEPRSALDAASPSGMVWVDTSEFVIVRQEVDFVRSPVPLLLKGIDRMVIERQRVDGIWVLHRMLLRARFTVPLPQVGRSVDMTLQFTDYAINRGIDDAVFAKKDGK
jgi:hypothetical protein